MLGEAPRFGSHWQYVRDWYLTPDGDHIVVALDDSSKEPGGIHQIDLSTDRLTQIREVNSKKEGSFVRLHRLSSSDLIALTTKKLIRMRCVDGTWSEVGTASVSKAEKLAVGEVDGAPTAVVVQVDHAKSTSKTFVFDLTKDKPKKKAATLERVWDAAIVDGEIRLYAGNPPPVWQKADFAASPKAKRAAAQKHPLKKAVLRFDSVKGVKAPEWSAEANATSDGFAFAIRKINDSRERGVFRCAVGGDDLVWERCELSSQSGHFGPGQVVGVDQDTFVLKSDNTLELVRRSGDAWIPVHRTKCAVDGRMTPFAAQGCLALTSMKKLFLYEVRGEKVAKLTDGAFPVERFQTHVPIPFVQGGRLFVEASMRRYFEVMFNAG
ncbi:MAG: hypothetical protein AAGE52_12420 [Myxococcota bacterium]